MINTRLLSIKEKVGNKKVILALSGGVDSSVAAVLIHKAIGDQLNCFFVDTGLMRKNEAEKVMSTYGEHFKMNIECVNAEERFLTKLAGVSDPEAKRKIIGNESKENFQYYQLALEQVVKQHFLFDFLFLLLLLLLLWFLLL